MNWKELKDKIYLWDGSWLDIYVLNSNRTDWQTWVDFVNQKYSIKWFNGKTDRVESQIDFNVIEEYWSGNGNLSSTANVFIEGIQINAHFFTDVELENDIDPREFNSLEDHNKLIEYMSGLSIALNKEVILTPENQHEIVLMTVFNDRVELSKTINPFKWCVRIRKPYV